MKNDMLRRNLDLWNDRQHGFTYQQLSDKYCISRERCRQIYLRVDRQMLSIENEARKVRLNSLYGIFAYQDTDGLKVKTEADNE